MGQINPFIVAANQPMTESRFREHWTRLEESRGNKLSEIQYLNFSLIEIVRIFGASIRKLEPSYPNLSRPLPKPNFIQRYNLVSFNNNYNFGT